MTTIATLAVKLLADAQGFLATMNEAERKSQTWSANVSKNLKEAGGKMVDFGQKATMGLTLPIVGAGMAAINYASDLEETKNKVNVVFGSMSKDVLAWSQNSATAMGQSQDQALGAAATYGNLFVSLGLGQRPAADMSMSLVQLASDLASFNNANPQEVLDALRSGLSGEIEPLKKYGVAMNEAIMKQKAMEMGLGDNIQALTEAEKLQIRYAIIMEQTTTAQGDFARTADGLANQQRILKAQFVDAGAALGQKLLPYALQLVQWVSGLIAKFQALSPEQQKWIMILLGVAAVLGPVVMVVGSLVTGIGAIIPIVTAVAGALSGIALPLLLIIGVLALLYLAWTNNWGGIQEKTAAAMAWIRGLIAGGMQFINDLTSGKLGWLSQLWNNTLGAISAWWQIFTTNIKLIGQAFTAAFHGDWYTFGEKLRMVWDNMWMGIKAIAQIAWENLKILFSNAVTNIINFFRNTDWGQVGKNIIVGIANGVKAYASWLADSVRNAAANALEAVQGFLGIHSESKVFKQQVGWEMGAGTASGWRESIDKLLMPAFGMLTPAPAAAMPGSFAPDTGVRREAGDGESRMLELLEEIAEKETINYEKLARMVRDAVLMRAQ